MGRLRNDYAGISEGQVREELESITLAASVVASGHVRCVACAHLLLRYARELPWEVADPVQPPWPLPPGFSRAWKRSQMLGGESVPQPHLDIIIVAPALHAACIHAPRCAACGEGAPFLTAAGVASLGAGLAAYGDVRAIADMGWLQSGGRCQVPFSINCWCGKGGLCACGGQLPPPE